MSQVQEQDKQKEKTVKVEVSYLPATHDFEKRYARDTALSTVRTEAMASRTSPTAIRTSSSSS